MHRAPTLAWTLLPRTLLVDARTALDSSFIACRHLADEAVNSGEVGAVSGAPDEVLSRKVIIYSPARTASQQGMSKTLSKRVKGPAWKMEFTTKQKWENPLIGWTSTADPLENVGRAALNFDSAEDAANFCRRHGWEFEIREPHARRTMRQKRFLGYGDNFSTKRAGIPDGGLISEGTAQPFKKKGTGL